MPQKFFKSLFIVYKEKLQLNLKTFRFTVYIIKMELFTRWIILMLLWYIFNTHLEIFNHIIKCIEKTCFADKSGLVFINLINKDLIRKYNNW